MRTCETRKYKKLWVWTGYVNGIPVEKVYYVFPENEPAFKKHFKTGTGEIINREYI